MCLQIMLQTSKKGTNLEDCGDHEAQSCCSSAPLADFEGILVGEADRWKDFLLVIITVVVVSAVQMQSRRHGRHEAASTAKEC